MMQRAARHAASCRGRRQWMWKMVSLACVSVHALGVGPVAVGAARRRVSTRSAAKSSPHHDLSQVSVSADGGHSDLRTLVFEPTGEHTATMILTHGLGDTADGWAPAVAYHYAPALPYMKFVLPTAPSQQVTLNMGMMMPSWYDIVGLSDRDAESCDGIEQSQATLLHLIQQEVEAGVPLDRIVLAGFSQGGALSLFTGLQMPEPVAALVIKSAYMPCPSVVERNANRDNLRDLPMLFCHGDADPMVLPEWGKRSADALEDWGATRVERKTYAGMQHSACEEELADVITFVKKVLEGDNDE